MARIRRGEGSCWPTEFGLGVRFSSATRRPYDSPGTAFRIVTVAAVTTGKIVVSRSAVRTDFPVKGLRYMQILSSFAANRNSLKIAPL